MTCTHHSAVRTIVFTVFILLLAFRVSPAQDQTVGLLQYDPTLSFEGYTLLAPQEASTIYLIDNYGRLVHSWDREVVASSEVYLLPNGHLLRGAKTIDSTGTIGRTIQEIAWDGAVVWSYDYTSDHHIQHHDIEPLPNGNVLLLAKEHLSMAEAIAAGRDPSLMSDTILSPEVIVEVQPTGPTSGVIVWEWHAWDHLIQDYDFTAANYGVVENHPELIDVNFINNTTSDWLHGNSVAYNEELDQVVISSRHFHEIWIIDHSTTTAEAAGHTGGNGGMGGDILYRWGNPVAYRAGTADDQTLFGPHDAHWIGQGIPGGGNIILFNNGWERPGGKFSTIDEISTTVDGNGQYPLPDSGNAHGPAAFTWTYLADPPSSFYSANISGTQRLPSGNTLICCGRQGWLFEVTPEGGIVWQYLNPVTQFGAMHQGDTAPGGQTVFRCRRYASDYPGLDGRDLTPKAPIELYDITISGTSQEPSVPWWDDSVTVTSTVWSDSGVASVELQSDGGSGFAAIPMYDDGLHHDGVAGDSVYGAVIPPYPGGTVVAYYIQAETPSFEVVSDPVYAPTNAVYSYEVDHDYPCGDIDASNTGPDIADLVYLVDYMFNAGPPPSAMEVANIDGLGELDISDLVYLVDYMFTGGPEPVCTE